MNNYIDLHSHILDSIDDGSRNLEESVEIVKKLNKLGFIEIVATPHYIEGSSYTANNKVKKMHLDSLKEELKKNKVDTSIYLGNEIFICQDIDKYIVNGEIYSINNTNYILVELPFENEISNLDDYLFRLKSKGCIPIIAHPERYKYFQENPSRLKEYIDMGIIFQSNYGSIVGANGKHAKKALKYFLKNNYISILSSDVHRMDSGFFKHFPKAIKKITKIVGKDKIKELTYTNAYKVINNIKIEDDIN